MPGKVQVVVGGQFGSEAKGAVAGHLARWEGDALLAMRVAGPNAGHTVIDDDGRTWRLRQVPVAAVTNHDATLAIGAGSEIDERVLDREVHELQVGGHPTEQRIHIDRSATMIEPAHQRAEMELVDRIGSTGKGIGAARSDRILREAELYGGDQDTASLAQAWLTRGGTVQIEGTQGYGLGLHTSYYPHTTSSDCRAIDFLAMAGISPWLARDVEIWVVYRTYPIRVAGPSGPLAHELSWDELAERTAGHIQPELTTVTQKTRRVGSWDSELAKAALYANGWPSQQLRVAITHLDYLFPDLANVTGWDVLKDDRVQTYVQWLERLLSQSIDLVGTGPAAYTEVEH